MADDRIPPAAPLSRQWSTEDPLRRIIVAQKASKHLLAKAALRRVLSGEASPVPPITVTLSGMVC
jgi:uncharacterized membrane protein (UPF0136 family)